MGNRDVRARLLPPHTSHASAHEDGELIRDATARAPAADQHEGEGTVLTLAHKDEAASDGRRRLRCVVPARGHVKDAVELELREAR